MFTYSLSRVFITIIQYHYVIPFLLWVQHKILKHIIFILKIKRLNINTKFTTHIIFGWAMSVIIYWYSSIIVEEFEWLLAICIICWQQATAISKLWSFWIIKSTHTFTWLTLSNSWNSNFWNIRNTTKVSNIIVLRVT